MVEYKIDAATGAPYLMEINGRLWGSLQLAIDAGVDFPSLLVASAMGTPPEPVRSYHVGTRSRWWWGEVDHVIARLRDPADVPGLPSGFAGRMRALADFVVATASRGREEIFRVDDPRPFLRETADWLRGR